MKSSLKILAAASLSLLAAACAQFDAAYKPNTDSITFAAETAANPGLLQSLGHATTPDVTSFPSAAGGTNVNSKEFAARTAANPGLLQQLGQAETPSISQFGEYIPESEGGGDQYATPADPENVSEPKSE